MRKLLGILILMTTLVVPGARGQGYSPTFQAVLAQVDQRCLRPQGLDLASVEQSGPSEVARLVGLVMRGQQRYLQANPGLRSAFLGLEQEARRYFHELAKGTGFREPFSGEWIDADVLLQLSFAALRGRFDHFLLRTYPPATWNGPSVFARAPAPFPLRPTPRSYGRLGEMPDEPRRNFTSPGGLLGETSGGVESNWKIERNPRYQGVIPPGTILGTWRRKGSNQVLVIRRKGAGYHGVVSPTEAYRGVSYDFTSWKPHTSSWNGDVSVNFFGKRHLGWGKERGVDTTDVKANLGHNKIGTGTWLLNVYQGNMWSR